MHYNLSEEKKNQKELLLKTVELAQQFLNSLEKRPAGLQYENDQMTVLSSKGKGTMESLQYFQQEYEKNLSGSAGPRYLGFVTGGSTPAALVGDWLTAAIDQNVASAGDSSANQIEYQTIHWLKELFNIAPDFYGTFVTGATMSSYTNLAIARQWLGKQLRVDIAREGLSKLGKIKVLSGTPHSSIYKALSMLGLGRDALEKVALIEGREAIDIQLLEQKLKAQEGAPCIVVGNAGTVNTVDFDNLRGIGELKKRFNFWFHIDAAFGGFAACVPKFAHLVNGLNTADSITVDLHKFLNVPYDAAIQLSRFPDLQKEVFQNSDARYLEVNSTHTPFVHLTPENSRRFRALPTWFTLNAYGREGYEELVERNVQLAKKLGQWLDQSEAFDLLAPVNFNVACFSISNPGENENELIRTFLQALTRDGRVFLTPSSYKGKPCIRAAFSNWQTTEADLEIIKTALLETIQSVRNHQH